MNIRQLVGNGLLPMRDDLAVYAQRIMAPMPRSDQRRWGETYLRGLLLSEGRRSVRRIADGAAVPDAVQSLQQFVNQSPWDWAPVRAEIARYVRDRLDIQAWLIRDVYITKRGSHSIGVARRYVPSAGRKINCQHGLGLFLSDNTVSIPVDWQLVLSSPFQEGGQPAERPDGLESLIREQKVWENVLSLVDRMMVSLPPRPVVIDMRHAAGVENLANELHKRRMPFVIEVSGSLPVIPTHHPTRPDAWSAPGSILPDPLPARALIMARSSTRRPMVWSDPGSDIRRRTSITAYPVWLPGPGAVTTQDVVVTGVRGTPRVWFDPPPYHLVAAWSAASDRPAAMWLTNLPPTRVEHGLSVAGLAAQRLVDIAELSADYGLLDFEGRSFRGWHHHMTLVSAAYAFAKLDVHEWDLVT